jgi:hypothetical protein
MKYRIIQDERWYKVQTRPWWWPFWSTDSHYKWYDKPEKRERHGGFFGDIITEETVYGYHTTLHSTKHDAESRIKDLKRIAEEKRNRKPSPKPRVVHTE